MGISIALNCFLIGILVLILILFIKQFYSYIVQKESFFNLLIKRYSRSTELMEKFVHKEPSDDIFITVLYHCKSTANVVTEQIKCILRFLESSFPEKKEIEIILFITPSYYEITKIETLSTLIPNCIISIEEHNAISSFIHGSLRARGQFIIEADQLSTIIDSIPKNNVEYLSLIEPHPKGKFNLFESSRFLYPAGISKGTFMKLFPKLRQTNDSIATELLILSKKLSIAPIIKEIIIDEKEYPLSRIFACNFLSYFVKLLYDSHTWTYNNNIVEDELNKSSKEAKKKDE